MFQMNMKWKYKKISMTFTRACSVQKCTLVRGIGRTGCQRLSFPMSTGSSMHFLENKPPSHILDLPLAVCSAWFSDTVVGVVCYCIQNMHVNWQPLPCLRPYIHFMVFMSALRCHCMLKEPTSGTSSFCPAS
jgi:hypothetical protein